MTAAWMAYALLVGALVAVAAHALESVFRLAARPARGVWAGAMVLTIALVALAPHRAAPPDVRVALLRVSSAAAASVEAPRRTLTERFAATLRGARGAVTGAMEYALAAAARLAPAPLERGLAVLWLSLSGLALALIFVVHGRFLSARRQWPVADLHGARVRLAPDAGPAVVGLARPEIVVPRWLLQRSDAEQRMVIAHEVEHVRARDPLLLTAAWVAAALVAWHPAIWWMLSRLRLAVELDCDERIMRTGVTAHSYGALLIELAGHCSSGMRLGAPALADGNSHLKRRLLAMTQRRPKFARATGSVLAACSLALFALACEAKLPTTAEVDSMDVSAAESAAQHLALVGPADSLVIYTIDGRAATAQEAHALSPGDIARIEVLKKTVLASKTSGSGKSGEVRILTKRAADSLGIARPLMRTDSSRRVVTLIKTRSGKDTIGARPAKLGLHFETLSADTVVFDGPGPKDGTMLKREPFKGVILIDGVRVDSKALEALPRDAIMSVEVTKGAAARKLYADSAAANGVISITTRGSAPK